MIKPVFPELDSPKQQPGEQQASNQPQASNWPQAFDWQGALEQLSYAYGKPAVTGLLKAHPEDFCVSEITDVVPSGEGEHYWLDISKTKVNTEQLAKALARFAKVNIRDVGYSGMKDFFAETRQCFSVWLPKGESPDWSSFVLSGVTVHQVVKHSRKIKRGTHRANRFEILLRDIQGDIPQLEQRLEKVRLHGVPNYFGSQRFGRGAENMNQASAMLLDGKRVKNRNLRGIFLSAARSWLFNQVVSARVREDSWCVLQANEPANLNGSNSIFNSLATDQEQARLVAGDIHATAPMWGEGSDALMSACEELARWEQNVLAEYSALQQGLEDARLNYQRRAMRTITNDLTWEFIGADLRLTFELQRGQFATSVIRELVDVS